MGTNVENALYHSLFSISTKENKREVKKILFEIRTEYMSFKSLTVIHDVVICHLRDNIENQNHTRTFSLTFPKQILKLNIRKILKEKIKKEGPFVWDYKMASLVWYPKLGLVSSCGTLCLAPLFLTYSWRRFFGMLSAVKSFFHSLLLCLLRCLC